MAPDTRKQLKQLFNISLPGNLQDVRFYQWKPNPDLLFYQAYVKFSSGREVFDEFAGQFQTPGRATGAKHPSNPHLPANWEAPPNHQIAWWNPSPETPADAIGCDFGANGWLVAKHEDGAVFVIITDSGERRGTPGPF